MKKVEYEAGYLGYTRLNATAYPYKPKFMQRLNQVLAGLERDGSIERLAKSYDLVNPLYSPGDGIQACRASRVLGLISDGLVIAHGFAKSPDRFAEIRPQASQAPGSEQHDHDQQDDQDFSGTEAT